MQWVGSELVEEFCSSSKSGGSGDRSLIGEMKASLIVFASSDILGVPRRCCRCLLGSLRFSYAGVMPLRFFTSFFIFSPFIILFILAFNGKYTNYACWTLYQGKRIKITILKQKIKNKDKYNISAVRNKGKGVLNISKHITLYFYYSYQGEDKENFRMLHLVWRAVSLFVCWAAQR